MLYNKRRNAWELEDASTQHHDHPDGRALSESTVYHSGQAGLLLKDTVIYCAAERYGLDELKRLALRKQGLQGGIEVGTVLRSARYAYDHTPDTDSRLRAHYLTLIIRCRKTFKKSGTMQIEMEAGGRLFFDLFVSLCNHVDDVYDIAYVSTSLIERPLELPFMLISTHRRSQEQAIAEDHLRRHESKLHIAPRDRVIDTKIEQERIHVQLRMLHRSSISQGRFEVFPLSWEMFFVISRKIAPRPKRAFESLVPPTHRMVSPRSSSASAGGQGGHSVWGTMKGG